MPSIKGREALEKDNPQLAEKISHAEKEIENYFANWDQFNDHENAQRLERIKDELEDCIKLLSSS
ncbi:MAG: hypothetical protein IIA66_04245 [Planctomycetes bacterium]|nr:hypothetical protein [Planctomycetota bacterium]